MSFLRTWEQAGSGAPAAQPGAGPARAVAVPAALDLGGVPLGSRRTITIKIDNATRGHLSGEAQVAQGGRGLSLDRTAFEGAGSSIRVTVDPTGVPVGSRQRIEVRVTSNGGSLTVPVR